MELVQSVVFIQLLFIFVTLVNSENLSVKISAREHVNLVSDKFLSFAVDPKFLFSKKDGVVGKDCLCMASSLSPAYIRIAGPSTSHIVFHNSTIIINSAIDSNSTKDNKLNKKNDIDSSFIDNSGSYAAILNETIAIDTDAWKNFAKWANSNNFELVFGLNDEEKTGAGIWDPNTAMDILTVADKSNIENIVWQLGYDCANRTTEEYLDDLETLRVMVNTFRSGKIGTWKVVAGDVTNCLSSESKSDFAEFIVTSNDMLDAVFLNGNSSSSELAKMSDADRLSLLQLLSNSATPLWITERWDDSGELDRAVDWMNSLGFSARNGFSVHFREIGEDELYEPTLSFYMSLLFKNLVGNRVLDVEIDNDISISDKASLFAHCTTLKNEVVPGAITLFGSNLDDQVTRFSIKLSKREEGGDIMQFILSLDRNGNIIMNGLPLFFEGEIKPVVKRVRPYKSLLVTLPPKSFGFWVLANTKIEACLKRDEDVNNQLYIEATPVKEISDKMTFTQQEKRPKREVPNKNNIILHKMIKDNEIVKEKFRPEIYNDLTERMAELKSMLDEVQSLLNLNGFADNLDRRTTEDFDSEGINEFTVKQFPRQKRQTISDKLRAKFTKVTTNIPLTNKPESKVTLSKSVPAAIKIEDISKTPKVADVTKDVKAVTVAKGSKLAKITKELKMPLFAKETKSSNIVKSSKLPIVKSSKHQTPLSKYSVADNASNKENAETKITSSLVSGVKSRLDEFKNRLQARREALKNPKAPIVAKRHINGGKHAHKETQNPENVFTKISNPNVERSKRSVDRIVSENDIKWNVEDTGKSPLKKLLNKLKDDLPHFDLSDSYDDDITVEHEPFSDKSIRGHSKKKNNEIIKEKYEPEYDDEAIEEQLVFKTKISEDDASINISENSNNHGLLKIAFQNLSSMLNKVNDRLTNLWAIMPALG